MRPDPPAIDKMPLVVDLDGTLVRADIAMESLVRVACQGWRAFLGLMLAMLGGRTALKVYLARQDPVNPQHLPLRQEVVALIREARIAGRPVILASAAHQRNVQRVARHLGLFDLCLGSTRRLNRKDVAKLKAIRAVIGDTPFDYIGDSSADRAIWTHARIAYTVGVATGCAQEQRLGSPPRNKLRALGKAMRVHQWAKNALLFIPLATSGHIFELAALLKVAVAFVCLSIVASSVYLLNDLLDIDADRRHAKKKKRPLAAGELPIPAAVASFVAMAFLGLGASFLLLGSATLAVILVYFALTLAYSLRLKSAMIVDVLVLACLYTLRIITGAVAIGVAPSFWLLSFSIFFFLSLGYLKRFIELLQSRSEEHELLSGRGYVPSDTQIVALNGVAAGMVSLLVMLLFAEEMRRSGQYALPSLLWLLIIPLLYWLNRIWMMAQRGQVDGDPVAFAIRDKRSISVGLLLVVIVLSAKYGLVV